MATVTIKNIPDGLYDRLKKVAAANRRSINSEIIISIERAVLSQPVDPEALIARARFLRELTAGYHVADEELIGAKNEGRP